MKHKTRNRDPDTTPNQPGDTLVVSSSEIANVVITATAIKNKVVLENSQ